MKRVRFFFHEWIAFLLGLMFFLVACTAQPTWQEQYDLGMRYLSESNYEQAILAFTAAIEIDPQRPESYLQLAEIYLENEEIEQALELLQQGFERSGDLELKRRLEQLQKNIASYLPDYAFAERTEFQSFLSLPEEQQHLIDDAIVMIEGGNIEDLSTLASNDMAIEVLTMYKGYKIQVISGPNLSYQYYINTFGIDPSQSNFSYSFGPGIILQIRPENGQGFIYSYYSKLAPTEEYSVAYDVVIEEIVSGECIDWEFEGDFSMRTNQTTNTYVIYYPKDEETGEQIATRGEANGATFYEGSFEGHAVHSVLAILRGHSKSKWYNMVYHVSGDNAAYTNLEYEYVYHWDDSGACTIEIIALNGTPGGGTSQGSGLLTLEDW